MAESKSAGTKPVAKKSTPGRQVLENYRKVVKELGGEVYPGADKPIHQIAATLTLAIETRFATVSGKK